MLLRVYIEQHTNDVSISRYILLEIKVIQYGTKKEASGEIFVDGTKEDKALLEEELDKIGQSFGGGKGVDMISFPSFKFKDPIIDSTDPLSEEIFFVTG